MEFLKSHGEKMLDSSQEKACDQLTFNRGLGLF